MTGAGVDTALNSLPKGSETLGRVTRRQRHGDVKGVAVGQHSLKRTAQCPTVREALSPSPSQAFLTIVPPRGHSFIHQTFPEHLYASLMLGDKCQPRGDANNGGGERKGMGQTDHH